MCVCFCTCVEDTLKNEKKKKKKREKLRKTHNKQSYLFYWPELLIRFSYLKVPDARIAVYFKALCARDWVFCQDASCQGEIMDF